MGRDNPVRFIDAFVDGLDLAVAGFERATPKATGRPGYDPADLLKLYIYGYLNRVRSSRRLEAESKRNLEVIWLLRRLSPDFKTIADFRRINRAAFRQVFREFVRLCRELELFRARAGGSRRYSDQGSEQPGAELYQSVAGEGVGRERREVVALSRPARRGRARRERHRRRRSGEHPGKGSLRSKGRRERFEEHRDALAASGEDQLSLTDPDSRAMHAATRVGVGYNIQIAVDAKHKLIAEQQVHSKVSDLGLLAETAVAARRNLAVDRIDAVADAGYFKIEDIEACENAGVMPHVPKPQRGSTVSQGLFPKERFRYDARRGHLHLPRRPTPGATQQAQAPRSHLRQLRQSRRVQGVPTQVEVYEKPPSVGSCAMSTKRSWSAWQNDWRPARSCSMRAVKASSIPSAQSKQWMGQGAFLTRRLENVRGEFSITALAYNIRRAISLVGVPALIAAARA